MNQSKSISIILARLKLAYPYYFKNLNDEEFIGLISMFQDGLEDYSNNNILLEAVKSIIKKSKFMPTIKEIIDECELIKISKIKVLLKDMLKDGYFRTGIVELNSIQENKNFSKAVEWINLGIIPDWFKEDMKKYILKNKNKYIKNETFYLLEV